MSATMDLHHSIDAKHAQNIGEQSVSDRVQAVIEIVKNSYDADALNCTVRFFARSGGSGTLVHIDKIVISDDGIVTLLIVREFAVIFVPSIISVVVD